MNYIWLISSKTRPISLNFRGFPDQIAQNMNFQSVFKRFHSFFVTFSDLQPILISSARIISHFQFQNAPRRHPRVSLPVSLAVPVFLFFAAVSFSRVFCLPLFSTDDMKLLELQPRRACSTGSNASDGWLDGLKIGLQSETRIYKSAQGTPEKKTAKSMKYR